MITGSVEDRARVASIMGDPNVHRHPLTVTATPGDGTIPESEVWWHAHPHEPGHPDSKQPFWEHGKESP